MQQGISSNDLHGRKGGGRKRSWKFLEEAGIAAYVFTDELDGVIGTPEEVEDFLVAQCADVSP